MSTFDSINLTGTWTCKEDNGTYRIRQFSDHAGHEIILWHGSGHSHDKNWSNVCKGDVVSTGRAPHEITTVNAIWADVPCGETTAHGTLILDVVDKDHLRKKQGSSPYWGSNWTRSSE